MHREVTSWILAILAAGSLQFGAISLAEQRAALSHPPEKPNILVVLSNDQGYADAGVPGSKAD